MQSDLLYGSSNDNELMWNFQLFFNLTRLGFRNRAGEIVGDRGLRTRKYRFTHSCPGGPDVARKISPFRKIVGHIR